MKLGILRVDTQAHPMKNPMKNRHFHSLKEPCAGLNQPDTYVAARTILDTTFCLLPIGR
jgi:hypothetical protein